MNMDQGVLSTLVTEEVIVNGWDDRLKEVMERETQERCGACCIVACAGCKKENCRDRMVKYVANWRTEDGTETQETHPKRNQHID